MTQADALKTQVNITEEAQARVMSLLREVSHLEEQLSSAKEIYEDEQAAAAKRAESLESSETEKTEALDMAKRCLKEVETSVGMLRKQLEVSQRKSEDIQEVLWQLQSEKIVDEQQIASLALQVETLGVALQLSKDANAEQLTSSAKAAATTAAEQMEKVAQLMSNAESAVNSAALEASRLRTNLDEQQTAFRTMSDQLEAANTREKERMNALKNQALQELRSYEEILCESLSDVAEFMSPRTMPSISQRLRGSDEDNQVHSATDTCAKSARRLAEYSGRFEYCDIFGNDCDSQLIHYTDNSIIMIQAEGSGLTESSPSTGNTDYKNGDSLTVRIPMSMHGDDINVPVPSSASLIASPPLNPSTEQQCLSSVLEIRTSPTERYDTIHSISESITEIGAFGSSLRHRIEELEELMMDRDDEVQCLRNELLSENDKHDDCCKELVEAGKIISSLQVSSRELLHALIFRYHKFSFYAGRDGSDANARDRACR
jgi:hypothetical protein